MTHRMRIDFATLIRLGAVIALAIATAACGPVYRTTYDYIPPGDAAGKQCLNQCLQIFEMCRSTAENRASQERASCQQSATLAYAACVATAKSDLERSRCSSASSCNREADISHCNSEYRLCYQNCGGTVTSREVCVSGCQ